MLEINLMKFDKYFESLLVSNGISQSFASFLNMIILCGIIAVLAIALNFIIKQIIVKIIKRWVDKSTNQYDDIFYEKGVFNNLSHLGPALLISNLAVVPLADSPKMLEFVSRASNVYIAIVILMVLIAIINALHDIFNSTPLGKQRSIKGYMQAVKTVLITIGALVVLSIMLNFEIGGFLTKLGAFTAVLLFVFKDAILGFIAGIQISSNDILRVGDYIEMPNKNVDGTVIDIKLSTVKIHNTNKTISTLPTYAFVSETFWNWRGLELADGRRLRRFFNIDLSTIKYCDDEMLNKFRQIDLLKDYFTKKDEEKASIASQWHGKGYTNSSVFRAYIEAYLRNNSNINLSMNFMVRHLQPTENGLPIEVYVYTKEKVGPKYEAIQADIFDHIFAVVPEFGLKLFQKPTGHDVRNV
jgi:miniconductance mechanosensitive channel